MGKIAKGDSKSPGLYALESSSLSAGTNGIKNLSHYSPMLFVVP